MIFPIKYLVVFSSILTLVACQTATTDITNYSGYLQNFNSFEPGKTTFTVKKTDAKETTLTVNGTIYKFTENDLDDKNRANIFTQQNADYRVHLARANSDKQKSVDLWRIGVANKKTNGYETGFIAEGNLTAKMPTTGKATYMGGFGWEKVVSKNKPFDDYKDFWGDVRLDVNFEKGTIAGEFNNITDRSKNVKISGKAIIGDGKITNNKFTAAIITDATLNTNLGLNESLTGKLNAGFYGDNGSEIAGVVTLENKTYKGKLAFDATKTN